MASGYSLKDEEEYISEYEQWVMDNMSDESEPDNDEQTADDEDDDLEEESALDRFRGDGTRKAIINMNQQMKMTVRLLFSIVVVILISSNSSFFLAESLIGSKAKRLFRGL